MALQVWLPLNGDLHNQGLSNISITNNGTTINNNGKIGKCCEFGDGKYIKLINYASTFLTYTEWSLSVWFKCTAQNTAHSGSALISGGNWNSAPSLLNLALYNFSSDHYTKLIISNSNSWQNGYSYNFYLNQWYHVVLTSGNGKTSAYVNGQLIGNSFPAFKPNSLEQSWITIGNGTYTTVFHFYGLMNDVRIYNHCLSAKEVEEISKGLILHYPLNQGNENLLSNYVTPGQNAPGSTTTTGRTKYYGDYGIIIPATEKADTYFRLFLKQQLTQGETYTISCYVSGLLSGTYYNFPLFAQGNTSMGILQLNHNGLCSLTFTMNNSSQTAITTPEGTTVYICFMDDSVKAIATGQGPITLSGFKIEKGIIATPFRFNNNIIYDLSGYNNNGTIIGSLEAVTPSPRYNYATHFSATNQKIKIDNLTTVGFGNSYSFAWWEKINSVDSMHWGFANGIRLNGMYTGRLWNTGDSSSNPLYIPGTTTQVTAPSVNVWHHWVMTGDGTKCKVYQDGELWAEAKTYKGISGTTIYLNGWAENANYSSNNASMSDFRIYATALTEAQVKELYNTSATIDNLGNAYARELVE